MPSEIWTGNFTTPTDVDMWLDDRPDGADLVDILRGGKPFLAMTAEACQARMQAAVVEEWDDLHDDADEADLTGEPLQTTRVDRVEVEERPLHEHDPSLVREVTFYGVPRGSLSTEEPDVLAWGILYQHKETDHG